MTLTVKHATLTGAAANPDVLVDGPAWDASHTITGSVDATQMPALTGDVTTSAGSTATTLTAGSASVLNSGTLPAGRMPALTGDIATSAGAVATTLATVNANIGTFGSATQAAQITINGKGLTTAATNITITPAVGSITGLGTGVSTALGINVGSAGSFVANGGALGTPSSGTATNITGLPLSTGISGTGTGVLTALAINVGTAGSVLVNGGVLGTPSSGTLTNATGLPISTGVSGLAAGVATFLATPTSANLATAVTNETGSGALVFGTSPQITTPDIVGTSTNNNANAGSVGEEIRNTRASGAAVSLTTGVAANVVTLSLTAGDWIVCGSIVFAAGAGMISTEYHACTDLTTATINSDESAHAMHTTFIAGQSAIWPVGMKRYSFASTTTVYMNCTQTFSGGTLSAYGSMWGRRLR